MEPMGGRWPTPVAGSGRNTDCEGHTSVYLWILGDDANGDDLD